MGRIYNACVSILEKLGCHHEWQLVRETLVKNEFGGCFSEFHWVCKKCGKFKNTKSNNG